MEGARPDDPGDAGDFRERDVVFNITWTGDVYPSLRYFLASLLRQTDARFRYLVNACTPETVDAMGEFADRHADRVVEVMEVATPEKMIGHGLALDHVLRQRDDGPLFAFIDCDIKARGPFLGDFLSLLKTNDVVTSGKEVWIDSNVQPADHPGVDGQYFFRHDGFTYGSPHAAIYRRSVLESTIDRWGVSFGSGGKATVPEATWRHLVESGFDFLAFDTAKIVNILLQADGHSLVHREHENLIHIGGLSHYLAPPEWDKPVEATGEPTWTTWRGMVPRAQVAKYAAMTMQAAIAGQPVPPIPADVDDAMRTKLELVRHEVTDLIIDPGPIE